MKRRRINLLSHSLKKFDFVTAAKKLQVSLIGLLVVLLLSLGASAFINNYLTQELDALTKEQQPLLQYFQANSDFDKKISFFIYKNNLLKEYLKDDAKAYEYYVVLLKHINAVSPEAQLLSYAVDNIGETEFEVSFPNYDSAQIFLDAIEKPEFIKPFEYLKLSEFDVNSAAEDKFTLNIEGKFLKK